MLHLSKYIFVLVFVVCIGIVFYLRAIPLQVFAQSCGVTANGACGVYRYDPNAQYTDNQGNTCTYCNSFYASNDGVTCTNRTGDCQEACVAPPQSCQPTGSTAGDPNCSTGLDISSDYGGGSCGGLYPCLNGCTPPDCDTGLSCGACGGAPGNTCYGGNGSQSCDYTKFSGGGSCTRVRAGTYSCTIDNCDGGQGYFCSGGNCVRDCNTGTVNCQACHSGTVPTNQCGQETNNGTQTCQHNTWNGASGCILEDFSHACTMFADNCSANYTCPVGSGNPPPPVDCVTNIYVHVYIDYGHDGGNDANYPSGIVTINGGNAQTTGSDGSVTYSGLTTGTYTIAYSDNSPDYQPVGPTSQQVNLTNNNGNVTVNFHVTPLYTVSGNIFTDNNHNANYDGGDSLFTNNTTIQVTGGPTSVADMNNTDGTYSTGEVLESGTYTFTQTHALPGGYSYTTPTNWTVTVGDTGTPGPQCAIGGSPDGVCGNPNNGSISNLNFGINPPYQISGRVYNDINLNKVYDAGVDENIPSTPQIKISGPTNITVTASAAGLYSSGQVLLPGTYTVSYNSPLDTGYSFENKVSSYQVVVGYNPLCNAGSNIEASCGTPNANPGGSVNNLNFALTDENTQPIKPVCEDLRIDSGYSGFIPSTESCNGTAAPYAIDQNNVCPNPTIPGILFSGSSDPTYGAGSGASATGQQVGNTLYPEDYNFALPGINNTSYSFIKTTITNTVTTTPTNLTSICPNLTACTLSELTPGGIYETTAADGPVTLSVSNGDGSFNLGQENYIFLIGGDLTFATNITEQTKSTITFITAGDIDVTSNVGESNWNSTSPDLEGFFSTDGNFILDTATSTNNYCQFSGQPLDRKLNILGSVITNAAGTGGSIVNNRIGCKEDLFCPGITVTSDPIKILQIVGNPSGPANYTPITNPNAVLKTPYSYEQELNP